MAFHKEKGRLAEGSPIPKLILADGSEFSDLPRKLQVSKITRRCALSAAMATIVASLCFGERCEL